ncbi:SCO family protein [Brumimicrobium mesophilum]|uniref:SCO family protein n=1 Tax=Brumimicrobium mesophilum TaxID=392717 RepID=UPI00131C0E3C|nr:SCO family protein [Brumimicrobium mesophilum]
MISLKEKPKKINLSVLLSSILILALLFSCTEPENDLNQVNLPYIGHHDVVHEATEDYNIGDTVYHTVPRWNYLTQDSTFLKSDDIDDKIWIVDFIFTHCPTICPPMTKAMLGLNDSLNDYKNDLRFLSFSIDPDRDTPARLRLYRKRHDITAENWFFLTGNEAETHALGIDGFQLLANADEKAPGGFAHSPNFVLIDKDQHIRGVYDGLDPESRIQLIKDAKLLLDAK